ncbi:sugar phosphate isomerase/epimerase [Deinococcus sonorensis]|uniref:Sugar phosphate isomerase/epimerase n=2 Tax=Deinococcus sonorensis TaxID=309891 RepID=A0AAU7UFK2_9DEIO
MQNVGLQLYTLRDLFTQDFLGTLDAVAAAGVRVVELTQNWGGLSAEQLRAELDQRQMQAPSAHLPLQSFEDNLAGRVAEMRALGVQHVVYPYHRADSEAEWLALADRMERLAGPLGEQGLTLGYHNHDHELTQQFGGQPVLDLLLERAPSVKAELDVAWIHAGGQDPVAYVQRYADRLPLVHLKDVSRDGDAWQTVALGEGEVPLQAIIAALPAHTQAYYEQDHGGTLDTLHRSVAYLRG